MYALSVRRLRPALERVLVSYGTEGAAPGIKSFSLFLQCRICLTCLECEVCSAPQLVHVRLPAQSYGNGADSRNLPRPCHNEVSTWVA